MTDGDIRQAALRHLTAFAEMHQSRSESVLALVETAGGPASPGPSGHLQVKQHSPPALGGYSGRTRETENPETLHHWGPECCANISQAGVSSSLHTEFALSRIKGTFDCVQVV